MLWMTASAESRREAYDGGERMSALAHVTWLAQGGGVEEEVTACHLGSPDRLQRIRFSRGASALVVRSWIPY